MQALHADVCNIRANSMNSVASTRGSRTIDLLSMTHEKKSSFPKLQEPQIRGHGRMQRRFEDLELRCKSPKGHDRVVRFNISETRQIIT